MRIRAFAAPSGNYLDGTVLRDTLADILEREAENVARTVDAWVNGGLDHVYFVGCGGSRAIMEPAKWLMDRFSPLPADRYSGWEFVCRAPRRLTERSAVVLASHSGTTEEILRGLEVARERGARTAGFSLPDTPLARQVDASFVYQSPAANLSKLILTYLVTANLIRRTGPADEGERLLAAIAKLPDLVHSIKEAAEARSRELAAKYKDRKGFYVVGTGPLAGLAYQFQICTLMEMLWMHAASINAAEFRHGPFEIVDKGLPMIFLLGADESRPIAERALAFAQRHGADTIVFDLRDFPEVDPDLAPFAIHIPLQWFAWYLSKERNHPLATRRYMGKVPY